MNRNYFWGLLAAVLLTACEKGPDELGPLGVCYYRLKEALPVPKKRVVKKKKEEGGAAAKKPAAKKPAKKAPVKKTAPKKPAAKKAEKAEEKAE